MKKKINNINKFTQNKKIKIIKKYIKDNSLQLYIENRTKFYTEYEEI